MKKIYITTIFSIIFSINNYCQELSLKVELDKSKYLYGEPVNALVSLINTSGSPIPINSFDAKSYDSSLEIILLDQDGNKIKPTNRYKNSDMINNKLIIQPKDTISDYLQISYWFGNDIKSSVKISNNGFNLKLGNYKLMIKYFLKSNIEGNSPVIYQSNIESFSVLELTEKKDMDALEELKSIVSEYNDKYYDVESGKKYNDRLIKFISKNINSALSLLAARDLLISSMVFGDIKTDSRIDELIFTLLKNYPDSFISIFALDVCRVQKPSLFNSEVIRNIKYDGSQRKYNILLKTWEKYKE